MPRFGTEFNHELAALPNNVTAILDWVLALPISANDGEEVEYDQPIEMTTPEVGKKRGRAKSKPQDRYSCVRRLALECVELGLLPQEQVLGQTPTQLIDSGALGALFHVSTDDLSPFRRLKEAMATPELAETTGILSSQRPIAELEIIAAENIAKDVPVLDTKHKKKVCKDMKREFDRLTERTKPLEGDETATYAHHSAIPDRIHSSWTDFERQVLLLPNTGDSLLEFVETLPKNALKDGSSRTMTRLLKAAVAQVVARPDNIDIVDEEKRYSLTAQSVETLKASIRKLHCGPQGDATFDHLKLAMLTVGHEHAKHAKLGPFPDLINAVEAHADRVAELKKSGDFESALKTGRPLHVEAAAVTTKKKKGVETAVIPAVAAASAAVSPVAASAAAAEGMEFVEAAALVMMSLPAGAGSDQPLSVSFSPLKETLFAAKATATATATGPALPEQVVGGGGVAGAAAVV